jgi:hypothetical protein
MFVNNFSGVLQQIFITLSGVGGPRCTVRALALHVVHRKVQGAFKCIVTSNPFRLG